MQELQQGPEQQPQAPPHPHINKPGNVSVQDEKPPQETNQKDLSLTNNPPINSSSTNQPTLICSQMEPLGNRNTKGLSETIQSHAEVIKKTLSEKLPSEALNIPPHKAPTFWKNAAQYTPEAIENHPNIAKGLLPPPVGGLTTTAKRVAAIARSTGVGTGAATVGSMLTQPTPPNGVSIEQLAEGGK